MFAGQMGCEALNFILKRIIKEERPKRMSRPSPFQKCRKLTSDDRLEMYGKGYGMPSSHAQFMAFFAVYLSLFFLLRHTPAPSHSHTALPLFVRFFLSIAVVVVAGSVALSRIYLNYHTPKQVLAGCAAGVVCGLSWFIITGLLRTHGWLDWALDLEIVRFFRFRDLVVSEDLCEAGWERWETKRKLRDRRNSAHPSRKSD